MSFLGMDVGFCCRRVQNKSGGVLPEMAAPPGFAQAMANSAKWDHMQQPPATPPSREPLSRSSRSPNGAHTNGSAQVAYASALQAASSASRPSLLLPTQAQIGALAPAAAVAVLREHGPAHAYIAATALARLNTFASKRIKALVAEEPSQDGLNDIDTMIEAGAVEACIAAMHAHVNPAAPTPRGADAAPSSSGDAQSQAVRVQLLAPFTLLTMMQGSDEKLWSRVEDEFLAARGVVALAQARERHPDVDGLDQILTLTSDTFMNFASETALDHAEKQRHAR